MAATQSTEQSAEQSAGQSVVLSLASARYRESLGGVWVSVDLDLSVRSGDLVFVQVDRGRLMPMIGDACCGLLSPIAGEARFMGRNWASQAPEDAAAMRSRIGRAAPDTAWLSFLSVADNVLLAQRHHTRRSTQELMDQAADLAAALDLPGLPLEMPDAVGSSDRHRAAIVRAFMGQPQLLILEQPLGPDPELTPRLLDRILDAQDRGTAVLWIDDHIPQVAYRELGTTRRLRLRRSGQLEVLA